MFDARLPEINPLVVARYVYCLLQDMHALTVSPFDCLDWHLPPSLSLALSSLVFRRAFPYQRCYPRDR